MPRLTLLPLLLAACSTSPPNRYVGQIAPPCPGAALLETQSGHALFVANDSAQILRGTATPDGAVATRLETPGIDKKPFVQTFTGQTTPTAATGTYTTPRCTAPVTLTPR